MKITMVSEHASPLAALGGADAGGQNVHVAQLSAALARRGHDVTVYTRRDSAELPDRVTAAPGYQVVPVTAGPVRPVAKDELLEYMEEFASVLRRHWAHEAPEVVHAHFWMSGLASVWAAGPRIPVVQTYHALGTVKKRHQGEADTSPPERVELERWLGEHVDRIAATCSNEVFELARMGVAKSAVSVVPCGVDLDLFTPDGPAACRNERHRLVAVGRLVPRKGFEAAIRALVDLPSTELIIAGGPSQGSVLDDPEARRLLRLAGDLGVADRVDMPGLIGQDRLPELLRSADLVVCTPDYEPFGIVPLEAMASGVPVVGTAVGGLTDTVVDGVTGLLVPAGKPAAVADAVRQLLEDAVLRARLASAARERAAGRYSWDRIAGELTTVYRKARAHRQDHRQHTGGSMRTSSATARSVRLTAAQD